MNEDEKKRYLGILIESLWKELKLISESSLKEKSKIAAKMIQDFYTENKEYYQINSIEEVETELEKITKNMKELRKIQEKNDNDWNLR